MTKHELVKITGFFLVWRACLLALGVLANRFLVYQPSFPYADALLIITGLPQWLYSWGNFDGVHYLTIVSKGYLGTGLIQAFFPVFPLSIKFLSLFHIQPVVGGLIISNLALWGVVLTWFSLVKKQASVRIAWFSLGVLLFFPSAFFLGALYSESLFLFFVLQAFYAASKQRWAWMGLCVFLATATRLVGVFLIPALVYELWVQSAHGKVELHNVITYVKTHYWSLFYLGFGGLGLVSYMMYLYLNFHDPLYFFHVQSEFGGIRQEQLVLWPQVVWRYIKILLTYRPFNLNYLMYVQELVVSLGTIAVLFIGRQKVRTSYLLFALGAYFLPPLTGTFSSMPRYVLVCFPLFLIIAHALADRGWLRVIWFCLSTIMLIFNTILFIQGYWVA